MDATHINEIVDSMERLVTDRKPDISLAGRVFHQILEATNPATAHAAMAIIKAYQAQKPRSPRLRDELIEFLRTQIGGNQMPSSEIESRLASVEAATAKTQPLEERIRSLENLKWVIGSSAFVIIVALGIGGWNIMGKLSDAREEIELVRADAKKLKEELTSIEPEVERIAAPIVERLNGNGLRNLRIAQRKVTFATDTLTDTMEFDFEVKHVWIQPITNLNRFETAVATVDEQNPRRVNIRLVKQGGDYGPGDCLVWVFSFGK